MKIHPEVRRALREGRPIVALESTIISHGMPYPQNVRTALSVEQTVRAQGAVPATMGIVEGEPVIGLTPSLIEQFGRRKGIAKVSKRDFPIVVANRGWGATTVSATILMAKAAGIEVFVTGGIGGVHRGAETSFDVSRDLYELSENPVTVVCSGAKAILDIGKTLELLETLGVPVLSYRAPEFANFYGFSSGYPVDSVCPTPRAIAEVILAQRNLGLSGGILVSNPIPEKHALPREMVDEAIEQALQEADKQGIKGKEVTPFLLSRVVSATRGKSLEANVALVLSNAKLGAQIAVALAALKQRKKA